MDLLGQQKVLIVCQLSTNILENGRLMPRGYEKRPIRQIAHLKYFEQQKIYVAMGFFDPCNVPTNQYYPLMQTTNIFSTGPRHDVEKGMNKLILGKYIDPTRNIFA